LRGGGGKPVSGSGRGEPGRWGLQRRFAFSLRRALAATALAFFARAALAAGVMLAAAVFPPSDPPILPPWRPNSRNLASTAAGSFIFDIRLSIRGLLHV
jgi:hypothetical protein